MAQLRLHCVLSYRKKTNKITFSMAYRWQNCFHRRYCERRLELQILIPDSEAK